MINPQEASRAWKYLTDSCDKIQDPVLRQSYLAVFKQRAIQEWGFCPDNTNIKPKEYTENDLPPLERFMYDKLQSALEYGVWERDEELEKENLRYMKYLIDKGYTFWDLPKEHQNDTIKELYFKALDFWTDEQVEALKSIGQADKKTV